MKRTLLSLIAIAGMTTFGMSQVEITIGSGPDISGGQHNESSAGAEVVVDLHVKNSTGASKDWTITRDRITSFASWTDYICWGHSTDPFGGTCYAHNAANPWATPQAVTIGNGEEGTLQVHIKPNDPDFGSGVYRYYVMDGSSIEDSVDIIVSKTAGIEEITASLSVSIAPNPASNYIKVKANGAENTTVKVVDVLGNIVLNETVMGSSKTINTSRFRNGVYFVVVDADRAKPVTRKVIVRH